MYPPYRFIPGTSANDFHYQAYLLEGLVMWSKVRTLTAIQKEHGSHFLRNFNMKLADKVYRTTYIYILLADNDGLL